MNDPQVMTYAEAARFLKISKRTLQRFVRERRVPYVQLPARGAWCGIRFIRADLTTWLSTITVKPVTVRSKAE